MALSDLKVYSEFVYSSMTEVLRQQVDLFNEASAGSIVLSSAAHMGDFSDVVMWANLSGLVRRRNAYGSGAQSEKVLAMIVDTMVKVAAGTPPVRLDPGQFKWIQKSPEEAGAILGQQLAIQVMADMLNTGLAALVAALSQITSINLDVTAATAPADLFTFANQVTAAGKFGDQAQQLNTWVLHSKPLFDMLGQAITNNERLFTYGSVNVQRDPLGHIMVITDSPSLVKTGTPNKYYELLLGVAALMIGQNNDYTANEETKNGDENITRTFQAEWSYELGVKGFAWDKTNGGKSPNDSALFTSTNWDRYATSDKDLPGVLMTSH